MQKRRISSAFKAARAGAIVALAVTTQAAAENGARAMGVTHATYRAPVYTPPADRLDPQIALARINQVRAAAGLRPLTLDPSLAEAAKAHAADLAARDAISHYGRDGSTPDKRVAATGYDAVITGENVATGQRDFDEVLDGWLDSESHRRTLLLPEAVHTGLALVYNPKASYRTFWTMVVAEPF